MGEQQQSWLCNVNSSNMLPNTLVKTGKLIVTEEALLSDFKQCSPSLQLAKKISSDATKASLKSCNTYKHKEACFYIFIPNSKGNGPINELKKIKSKHYSEVLMPPD